MKNILLLGAGKIGSAIARLLSQCGDYAVTVGDADPAALERVRSANPAKLLRVNAGNESELRDAIAGHEAVISACSFSVNPLIATVAADQRASYFDLTEDVATTAIIRQISANAVAGQLFVPQCGLAPGFVSIAANHLARQFESLDEVHLRVGALPKFPTNEMKYNLTWSTDGLINEYGNACEAIRNGNLIHTLPLEGLEHFSMDGIDYEAFNTSGGVGTLCETYRGKVRNLDYKTIRYTGHRDLMAFLMNELRLNDRRDLLKNILENAVPMTPQDVVLIFCTATGMKNGRLTQLTDARKIYHGPCLGEQWGAIQITTASGLCAVFDLLMQADHRRTGFVKQEEISLDDFLANRFGRYYAIMPQEKEVDVPAWVKKS